MDEFNLKSVLRALVSGLAPERLNREGSLTSGT